MSKDKPEPHVRYYASVPLEPTEEMLTAADGIKGCFDARQVWQAMLEAAVKRNDT